MDLTKLSPAPWEWWTSNSFRRLTGGDGRDGGVLYAVTHRDGQGDIVGSKTDMEFIALARNAFAIQVETGLYVVPVSRKHGLWWTVRTRGGFDMPLEFFVSHPTHGEFQDPYTAIVEADKWLRESGLGHHGGLVGIE